jgi:putative DNA primase/helicase
MDAATIAKLYGGCRSGSSFVLKACPVCGYRDASVRNGDDGHLLFKCWGGGCDFAALMTALRAQGLAPGRADTGWTPPPCRIVAHNDQGAKAALMSDIARRIWRSTVTAAGTIVATAYLPGRGITIQVPTTIRYLSNALHKPTGSRRPCMVAAFARYPETRVCAIHRTFLTTDGSRKAPILQEKMTLGPVKGAAIRLASAGPVLLVAEGIETCLSAMQETGLPGWAAFSAGNMGELILPPLPRAAEVIICADHDTNGVGRRKAEAAARRWHAEGRRVRIALPPKPDTDFNDILRAELAAGAA